jgi:predicted nucleic acid-binding protein
MMAVDTSVVVAAFASWHESHAAAARVVAGRPDLVAPAALEAYAVLTRLPPPHRAGGAIVRDFLERAFPRHPLTLPVDRVAGLVGELVAAGVSGGATYDAVIAITAAQHHRRLVTLDARARTTYERIGVEVSFIS